MSASVGERRPPEPKTGIITASGWARSGKGTSMAHLRASLENMGKHVTHIDQGLKFRAMSVVAAESGEDLDSPALLNSFLQTERAKAETLAILDRVEAMGEAERKALLYSSHVSGEVRKVGAVPVAHEVAVGLMGQQVRDAVDTGTNVILIDGRAIEVYARQYQEEGLARFAIGWYFRCDPKIAAQRSLGIFGDVDAMSAEDKEALLREIFNISDRNRSDMQRTVDPLRDPTRAYELDLLEYASPDRELTPLAISSDIMRRSRGSMVMTDTSYTHSIEEMTYPVTELSKYALHHVGALSHADVGIRTAQRLDEIE